MSIRTYAGKHKRKLSSISDTATLSYADPRAPKKSRQVNGEDIVPLPAIRDEERPVAGPSRSPTPVSSEQSSPRKENSLTSKQTIGREATEIFELRRTPSPTKSSTWHSGNSNPRSPSKLSKRMLGKSKTESSIEDSPTTPSSSLPLEKAHSFPIPPSSLTLPVAQNGIPTLESLSPSVTPRRTAKKTYAGASRSYLAVISSSSGTLPTQQTLAEEEPHQTRESYAAMRKRLGVDDDASDPLEHDATSTPLQSAAATPLTSPSKSSRKGKARDIQDQLLEPLPEGMMNPLKSITELRSKGEAQRFMDEAGYLLEGLALDKSIGLRRASALEIISKLCDKDFARRARLSDFVVRTWDLLSKGGDDLILDVLVAFFAAISSQDEPQLVELAARPQFVERLFTLLADTRKDPLNLDSKVRSGFVVSDAEWKQAGIGRREKALILEISSCIRMKSGLFEDVSVKLSLSGLASIPLAAIPPEQLPLNTWPTVCSVLRSFGTLEHMTRIHLDNILQITEGFLARQEDLLQDHDTWMLDALVAALVSSEAQNWMPVIDISMRLLVALTHSFPSWAGRFLQSPSGLGSLSRILVICGSLGSPTFEDEKKLLSKEEDEEDTSIKERQDRLCLALAVLTNMVQAVEGAATRLRNFETNINCTCANTPCSCSTPQRSSPISILANLYQRQTNILHTHTVLPVKLEEPSNSLDDARKVQQNDHVTREAADAAFIRGHLAILFGLVLRTASREDVVFILDSLPVPQETDEGMTKPLSWAARSAKARELASQTKDVLLFFSRAASAGLGGREGQEEVGTVRDVVGFLEGLAEE